MHIALPSRFGERKGRGPDPQNVTKTRPCPCFHKGPLSPRWHPKVTLWAPKSELLGSLLAHFGHLGASLAPLWATLGTKWPHRGTTATAQAHNGVYSRKRCPPGGPKWESAAVAEHLLGLGKTAIWHPGRRFRMGNRTFWQSGVLAGPKQSD